MPDSSADPSHRVTVEPATTRVRVIVDGQVIADSARAITLRETAHVDRHYLPREDVDWSLLQSTSTQSHCPVKGDAEEYWALATDPDADIAWSYAKPFDYLQSIAGYVAFYSERVHVEAAAPLSQ